MTSSGLAHLDSFTDFVGFCRKKDEIIEDPGATFRCACVWWPPTARHFDTYLGSGEAT